jgi:glutathione S-transferase
MLTLIHSPQSRSSRIITLIDEMGIQDWVKIEPVTILRQDGSGGRDTANPHPEGKVPLLIHDGAVIRESGAIIQYLTDMFPDAGLGRPLGHPQRGAYISWLYWYGSVMEPVLVLEALGLSQPSLARTFRGVSEVTAKLSAALQHQPYLLGDSYSAADLLVQSPYAWFKDATPDDPAIKDWVARCSARPSVGRTMASDSVLMVQAPAAA